MKKLFLQYVLLAAFAASADMSADTRWGDVKPTKTLGEIAEAAGLATTQYAHKAAADAIFALTNDFAANFTPLAAPLVTNLVEDVLAPRTLEFHYNSADGEAITNGFVAPMFATSKLTFVNDSPSGIETFRGDSAVLYSEGKRRNYSLLVEKIPDGLECFTITFYELATNHTIYAQPKLYTSKFGVDESGALLTHSWDISTNDVPCVITIREPDDHTLIVRRDRLNQDEVYLKLENGEAIMYIDGEEN